MNDIIIRTNSSEYSAGSIIYGVVYLRLLEPVVADTVSISVSGKERCKWKQTVPLLGQPLSRSRSTSEESTDTGFCDISTGEDTTKPEVSFKEIVFDGEHIHLKDEFCLVEFEEGVIPLGCYAFPFKYTLKQGLPNSFKRSPTFDEVKHAMYEAEIVYTITAKLNSSLSQHDAGVHCCHEIKVRKDDLMARKETNFNKTAKAVVRTCFCFPKGEIILNVSLEKVTFTLGETIFVKFDVQNKTNSINVSQAKIRLMKTMNLKGKRLEGGEYISERIEAFPEYDLITIPLEMGKCKEKSFNIPIDLKNKCNEHLATTMGPIVKNIYHLDVELDVPLDSDVSIVVPVQIYPSAVETWEEWTPPDWVREVQVHKVEQLYAVSRQLLISNEFSQIPLPFAALYDV